MMVSLIAPAGTETGPSHGGVQYEIDHTGKVYVDQELAQILLSHGYLPDSEPDEAALDDAADAADEAKAAAEAAEAQAKLEAAEKAAAEAEAKKAAAKAKRGK